MRKNKELGQWANTVKFEDIALVYSDTAKRSVWPLPILTKLSHGHDGLDVHLTLKPKQEQQKGPLQSCTDSKFHWMLTQIVACVITLLHDYCL